jgi:hypothetical protein
MPKVATVLGSIPTSSGTVESEGRQLKQCWKIKYKKILLKNIIFLGFASESDEDEGEGDEEELFEDDLEFLRSLDPKVSKFSI